MKIETKPTHHINSNDLDKAINEFLKKKGCLKTFEFVADHEMRNDSSQVFDIGEYDWAIPDDDEKAEILSGDFHYRGDDILEWMHHEGEIPLGNYVVEVSW